MGTKNPFSNFFEDIKKRSNYQGWLENYFIKTKGLDINNIKEDVILIMISKHDKELEKDYMVYFNNNREGRNSEVYDKYLDVVLKKAETIISRLDTSKWPTPEQTTMMEEKDKEITLKEINETADYLESFYANSEMKSAYDIVGIDYTIIHKLRQDLKDERLALEWLEKYKNTKKEGYQKTIVMDTLFTLLRIIHEDCYAGSEWVEYLTSNREDSYDNNTERNIDAMYSKAAKIGAFIYSVEEVKRMIENEHTSAIERRVKETRALIKCFYQ